MYCAAVCTHYALNTGELYVRSYVCTCVQIAAVNVEPANALSLPTWMVHVSSLIEWLAAMALIWRYAAVSGLRQVQ
jgi:hypothetical protein